MKDCNLYLVSVKEELKIFQRFLLILAQDAGFNHDYNETLIKYISRVQDVLQDIEDIQKVPIDTRYIDDSFIKNSIIYNYEYDELKAEEVE